MELIKGRWYRCNNWSETVAARYSGITGYGKYLFDEEVCRNSKFRKTDWLTFRTDFIEVPLSEIQQYLPEGHPDKEFVLKTKEMAEKPIYVKVVDLGEQFPTHPKAREYGMVNYYYWTPGSARLNLTAKYRVVKEIVVNGITESYILLDESTGYEYLIRIKGCEIIDNMEREIIGYKLKEDCKQFREAALKLSNTVANWENSTKPYDIHIIQEGYIRRLKEAKVFELWFEPILKEEFKVGDWVMETWGSSPYYNLKAFRIIRVNDEFAAYDRQGECNSKLSNLRPATPEEIKKTLVEEAIKRGFTKRVKINPYFPDYSPVYSGDRSYEMNDCLPEYEQHLDALRMGGSIIYHKGKWAEILPNYPQIEINGYKCEFFDWGVKFGCQKYEKEFVIKLAECIKLNGFKMDYKANVIQIADYYLNKK